MAPPSCLRIRDSAVEQHELPVSSFTATIDVQLATAFITVVAEFLSDDLAGLKVLEFPIDNSVSVTSCTIESTTRQINTCMLSKSDVDAYSASHKGFQQQTVRLDKSCFSIPFELHKKDKSLQVTLTYISVLYFDPQDGRLPATFNQGHMKFLTRVLIQASINASQFFQWSSVSHSLRITRDIFEVDKWENRDFEINYWIATTEILSTLMINAPGLDPYDPRATFSVNVHPPPDSMLTNGSFGRRIVFLIDISGSMGGDPIHQAKRALATGLSQLRHFVDSFALIAFNDKIRASSGLQETNPATIATALAWVETLDAGGGTDIMTPIQHAVEMLLHPSIAADPRIPTIFLITDGAVSNETEIYNWVLRNTNGVRFHTLGIGEYCNAYFLKMVAMAGRGLNDHITQYKNIGKQVLALIRSSTTPILTNVEVLLPVQSHEYEIFPYPIPDLYCGNPLIISGKASVPFDHALIRGMLPNGQLYQVQVAPLAAPILLHKIFVKQRLDYMIGQAWVSGNAADVQAVVKMSCIYKMPSPYTVMVAYQSKTRRPSGVLDTLDKADDISDIVIASVGGLIILVGLALTFGDVAGTLANVALDFNVGHMAMQHFGGGGGGSVDPCHSCDQCCNTCCNNICCRGNGSGGSGCGGGGSGGGTDCNGCCDCHGCCSNCDCCDCKGGCCDCDCKGGCCDCGSCDCGGCDCGGCDCNC